MLYAFLIALNALRFMQCSTWNVIQNPPEQTHILLGTLRNRLYIETTSGSVYCLNQKTWSKCTLPPYDLQPDIAPSWLTNILETIFQKGDIFQTIRSDSFIDTRYYLLLSNKQIFTCNTSFDVEAKNITHSWYFMWLIIPIIGVIWSIVSFLNIFIKYGQPTLWDFWGRGERIK